MPSPKLGGRGSGRGGGEGTGESVRRARGRFKRAKSLGREGGQVAAANAAGSACEGPGALLYFAARKRPEGHAVRVQRPLATLDNSKSHSSGHSVSMPGRKLSEKDLAKFKELLLHVRGVVTGDISKLEQDAFGIDGEVGGVDAVADGGSDSYTQAFSLELMEIDEHTLREIDDALDRIKRGDYGRCQECEQWLLRDRLRVLPHAAHCIDCQRDKEQS